MILLTTITSTNGTLQLFAEPRNITNGGSVNAAIAVSRQCARSFPKELVDAARIDGLGEINIFPRIFVPVMKASFACGIIICVMSIWNDYLWGLVIIRAPNMQTLQMFLALPNDGYTIDYGLMMYAVTMSTRPLALVFFFLQKTFVESITGSVKYKERMFIESDGHFFYQVLLIDGKKIEGGRNYASIR